MHLQQTKAGSRTTGGPQYYFHGVPEFVKKYLRGKGACPVVLQTPYGIAASPFMAVGRDHKLSVSGKPIAGSVGHDRIQAYGEQSIGEAIRDWYGLKTAGDFESIEVEVTIHDEGHFILVPTMVKMRQAARGKPLEKISHPLSFHRDYESKLWRQQIDAKRKMAGMDVEWASSQINRVVAEHAIQGAKHILESDLLRTSGALSLLGLNLSAYLGKGYDCIASTFQFSGLPVYHCPVEIKNRSIGLKYQVTQYTKLPRVVVLCMEHNLVNPPTDVDIVELPALGKYLSQ